MACTTCKNKCVCGDSALSIPATFSNDPTVCPPNSETCSEVFDMDCICYTGLDIVEFDIKRGDRLSDVMHKLILGIQNPACAVFSGTAHSPLDVTITNLTDTSLNVTWGAVTDAVTYVVEHKLTTSLTWLLSPAVTAPIVTDTLVGLDPDSIYDIRIRAVFAASSCYSLNFRFQTLIS